jgi:glycosyltransferase involved in cell wall biosynthesis
MHFYIENEKCYKILCQIQSTNMETNLNKFEISVIIPTYNRSKLLCYTLNSLVKQSLPKDRYEVIICDDGSHDDTAQITEKYKSFLNIKYVFQEDKGYRPASARNNGIKLASGKVCPASFYLRVV